MNRIALVLALASLVLPAAGQAQIGGKAGAYSRMGFGARGMGMGNALTAVTTGDVVGYYNPATLPFADARTVSASLGILSLDRKLNFVSYTQPVKPNAGISIGFINAGVSKIDGRDNNGDPTGDLRTSENQLFLAFGGRPASRLSLGVAAKLLHHHLYTDVTSVTIGLDFGALFTLTEAVTIGASVKDVLSKYKWDTGEVYGSLRGQSYEEKFPALISLGAACKLPDGLGVVAADIVSSNQSTLTARAGAEIAIIPELTVRAGIDRIDLKEKGTGIKPTVGFSLRNDLDGILMALHYAFLAEPFSPEPMHTIALSITF